MKRLSRRRAMLVFCRRSHVCRIYIMEPTANLKILSLLWSARTEVVSPTVLSKCHLSQYFSWSRSRVAKRRDVTLKFGGSNLNLKTWSWTQISEVVHRERTLKIVFIRPSSCLPFTFLFLLHMIHSNLPYSIFMSVIALWQSVEMWRLRSVVRILMTS